jgi:3-oxoadipate enol-lactonase
MGLVAWRNAPVEVLSRSQPSSPTVTHSLVSVPSGVRTANWVFGPELRAAGTRHWPTGSRVCGMTLSCDVAGKGSALLLLHSSVCDRRMWEPQWRSLVDAGYQVVRCDLRGFGGTPVSTTAYRNDEDVADLLDALGIEETAIIGSSFGGLVALEFAARWPSRVSALALLCAGAPGHESSAALREFGDREDELIEAGDIDAAVELNLATWLGPDATPQTRDAVRRMQHDNFDVQLAVPDAVEPTEPDVDLTVITAPTLVVGGGYDVEDFRQIAVDLAKTLPAAQHLELPWAGHFPSLERPSEVFALLTDFLGGQAAGRSAG